MIKWVVHDLITGQYTVGYSSGRVITYRKAYNMPITINNFIEQTRYTAVTGKGIIVYEA